MEIEVKICWQLTNGKQFNIVIGSLFVVMQVDDAFRDDVMLAYTCQSTVVP